VLKATLPHPSFTVVTQMTQICVTGPQCVKQLFERRLSENGIVVNRKLWTLIVSVKAFEAHCALSNIVLALCHIVLDNPDQVVEICLHRYMLCVKMLQLVCFLFVNCLIIYSFLSLGF
jgi:hypothetical protein